MATPTLITPTTTPKPLPLIKSKLAAAPVAASASNAALPILRQPRRRREFLSIASVGILSAGLISQVASPALAASDEEYVKETEEVINKVRSTISLDKNDPNVAGAVANLRETSNFWVAKYRREKALLGRASFRDIYSALNAVSGHYISFGPTVPIPAKRKARILEEVDTAEKALLRGR
ncbi:photosystem II repair protein PSB27-H1, chloroplastic [Rhodamnia argentea]|uniref:Photosystem II repair protein PSB27-H1, chloroplastic n=1 Tax=Rhodamnia argentea TaxID=178133 RepID=A0A8B8N3K3_9MYRT|nr:photosystem II repair protein PSB27-H1, chloroplastic [Rhodamnia argentea]